MNEPFRLRFVNQIVGAFILGIVAVMLVFTVYLIRAKELFTHNVTYEIHIEQKALNGLRQGTEVQILGQDAGRITHIDYSDRSNKVILKLAVKEPFEGKIFVDSTVHVRHKYGIGESYLEIMRGEDAVQVLEAQTPGQPIEIDATHFKADEDRIDQLRDEIRQVRELVAKSLTPSLESVQKAADTMNDRIEDSAAPAFRRFGAASENLDKTSDTIKESFVRFRASAENFDQRLNDLRDSVRGFEADSHDTLAGLRESTTAFTEATKHIQQVADESREVVGALKGETRDLPGTTAKFNDTLDGTQDIIEGLKRNWLLKRYMRSETSSRQTPPAGVRGGSGK